MPKNTIMWSPVPVEALRPWWPAVAFTLLIGLVRQPIVHAQSSAATPSHEAREVLTRIEKELSERLAYVSRPEQIPGEFRSLWASRLETVEGFQDWYYFFLPYAIRVADAEVDALEDLQDEVEKLRSNLETTPDALNAALDLSNAVSWTDSPRCGHKRRESTRDAAWRGSSRWLQGADWC